MDLQKGKLMFWDAFDQISKNCEDYLNSIKGKEVSIRNIDETLQELTLFIREFEKLRSKIPQGPKSIKMHSQLNKKLAYLKRQQDRFLDARSKARTEESNLAQIAPRAREAIRGALQSKDRRNSRQQLKEILNQVYNTRLRMSAKTELINELKKTLLALSIRDAADYETRKRAQEATAQNLEPTVREAEKLARSNTSVREARTRVKEILNTVKRSHPMEKSTKDRLVTRVKNALSTINERGEREYQQQQRQQDNNARQLETALAQIERTAQSSSDFRSARSEIKSVLQNIYSTQPLRRDVKGRLIKRAKDALAELNRRSTADYEARKREKERKKREYEARKVEKARKKREYEERKARQEAERQRKHQDFLRRQKENIHRKEQAIRKIRDSIKQDRDSIRRFYNQISNLRPGKKKDQIERSIHSKIRTKEAKIQEKERKINAINRDISDIQRKINR